MIGGVVHKDSMMEIQWGADADGPSGEFPGYENYKVWATGHEDGKPFSLRFTTPHDPNSGLHLLVAAVMMDLEVELQKGRV